MFQKLRDKCWIAGLFFNVIKSFGKHRVLLPFFPMQTTNLYRLFFICDKSWKILEQIFYQKLKITITAWNFEFIFVSNKILSKTISFMIDFQPPKIVIHLFESFHNFWTIIMALFLYYFSCWTTEQKCDIFSVDLNHIFTCRKLHEKFICFY